MGFTLFTAMDCATQELDRSKEMQFEPIKVKVIKLARSPFYKLRWTDPVTGNVREKSTRTKTEREAVRLGQRLQNQLQEKAELEEYGAGWDEFRDRYETEVVAGLAIKTGSKIDTVFNSVESILNPVLLRQIDANTLSQFVTGLRERGNRWKRQLKVTSHTFGRRSVGQLIRN